MGWQPEAQHGLLVVLGSVTPPGRLHRALSEAIERQREQGVPSELLDLARSQVAFASGRPAESLGDDTTGALALIAAADSLILATPVYRGSMTGALKNLLDHVPIDALRGKPVGLVAMGATDHHYLGADRHMRDVLAFFGAYVSPVSVYLTSAGFSEGVPSRESAAALDELFAGVLALSHVLDSDLRQAGPDPLAAGGSRSRSSVPVGPV